MPSADTLSIRQNGGIAVLSDRAKLRLTGADRVRFLNGQITANVTRLDPGKAIPACVTTAKGKLCAEVFVSATADALIVDAEPELRESLLVRLERYIISDDVAIEDVTESLALFHVLPAAGESLKPDAAGANPSREAARFGPAGLDFFVPTIAAESFLGGLAGGANPGISLSRPTLSSDALDVLRMECGVPRWGRELDEDTLPPEAGLDRTHIDYHKGCYIGQEVISRLKSVGHVNRRLVGFVPAESEDGSSQASFVPGDVIFQESDPGKAVGEITSVAFSTMMGTPVALGYLRRGTPMETLRAGRPGDPPSAGTPVVARELPFVA